MNLRGVRIPGATEFGRETAIEFAQTADQRGLETVWVGESWGQSSIPLLTQILERTDDIDVCTGIVNVYSRSPALIAMEAAALADLSGGRVRIGLGVSGPRVIEDFHGIPFSRPLRRTREYIEIIRSYLSGERVAYDGEIFTLSGFELNAETPVDVPLYVAAMGEHNLRLVGEFADGWLPLLVPHTSFEGALRHIERGADRANRSPSDIDAAPWIPTCISDEDPQAAVDAVRSQLAFYVGAMGDYYADAVSRFGFADEVKAIRSGWSADSQAGAEAAVPDEMVSAFGACGTREQASATIERFREAGADSPIAYVPTKWTSEALVRTTLSHL